MSAVPRRRLAAPRLTEPLKKRLTPGVLLTMLIEPPVDPRPVKADCGPLTTSTCSRLNGSRDCGPRSRTPSTKMSLRALKPRSTRLSPAGVPPSPATTVKPGTLRSTSVNDVAPCCSITSREMIEIVCGMRRSGSVYFGDVGSGCAMTSIDVDTAASSNTTSPPSLNRKLTPVSRSIRRNASRSAQAPTTPGDCSVRMFGSATTTCSPFACWKAAITALSGPAGMSNRRIAALRPALPAGAAALLDCAFGCGLGCARANATVRAPTAV